MSVCYSLSVYILFPERAERVEGNTLSLSKGIPYGMPSTPVKESSAFSTGHASSDNNSIVFGRSESVITFENKGKIFNKGIE
jgi:hypothetical protein